ncbi:hypothetical protein [Megamonas funiformis]
MKICYNNIMDKNVYEEGTLKYYSFFKDSKEMEEEQYGKRIITL